MYAYQRRRTCSIRFFRLRAKRVTTLSTDHATFCLGRPQQIPVRVEEILARRMDAVAEWGWPIGRFELKLMVKDILDRQGVTSTCFSENTPGDDWVENVVQRNKMSKRAAANITRARAGVDGEAVNQFFNHYEDSLLKIGEFVHLCFVQIFASQEGVYPQGWGTCGRGGGGDNKRLGRRITSQKSSLTAPKKVP